MQPKSEAEPGFLPLARTGELESCSERFPGLDAVGHLVTLARAS
jgi:hypothetical protein